MKNTLQLPKEPPSQPVIESHVDTTRDVRQSLLTQIRNSIASISIGRGGGGSPTNTLEYIVQYIDALEQHLDQLSTDIFQIVNGIAKSQVSHFGLRTNVKALVRLLERKGLVTLDELSEIHMKEILVEELPAEQREEFLQMLKEKDLAKEQHNESQRKDSQTPK